jgi:Ala-tRNA(Pro) deacylase
MPVENLKKLLDSKGVKYTTISHTTAFTAQEVAASARVPGKELAKTVIVKIDGDYAMAVMPASCKIDFELFRQNIGANKVELAAENEFRDLFPGCDIGAMPPFGSLYNMDVYVCRLLSEDKEIAFNAGSHTELIKMPYEDFELIVKPKQVEFCSQ